MVLMKLSVGARQLQCEVERLSSKVLAKIALQFATRQILHKLDEECDEHRDLLGRSQPRQVSSKQQSNCLCFFNGVLTELRILVSA